MQRRAFHFLGGGLETLGGPGDFVRRLILRLARLLGSRGFRFVQAGHRSIAEVAQTLLGGGARLTGSLKHIALSRFARGTGRGHRLIVSSITWVSFEKHGTGAVPRHERRVTKDRTIMSSVYRVSAERD